MDRAFRQSMSWLHTWAGVVFGSLLFAIFWMGTLSVFDKEVDRWMAPTTRLAMLVLCISGVIIHRKILSDFFVFRPQRQSRRATLDLHNLTGVLGLPFHLAITLSGLIIFYAIYLPSGWKTAYPDRQAFNADAYGTYARPRLNQGGGQVLFESIASESTRLWGEKAPRSLIVFHPGDAASYIAILRPSEKHVGAYSEIAYFDASTGALLHHREMYCRS